MANPILEELRRLTAAESTDAKTAADAPVSLMFYTVCAPDIVTPIADAGLIENLEDLNI